MSVVNTSHDARTAMSTDDAFAAVFARFREADVRVGRDGQWFVSVTTHTGEHSGSAWGDDLAATIVAAANELVSVLSLARA